MPEGIKEKRKYSQYNFKKIEDDEYRCIPCGATAIVIPLMRSIHIQEMPGAGFGQVKRIETPYCPKCDTRPKNHEIPFEIPLAVYFSEFRNK